MVENAPPLLVEEPAGKRKFLGISVGDCHPPKIRDGTHLYVSLLQADGKREVNRITEAESTNSISATYSVLFYHVGLGHYRFSPLFAKVFLDEMGNDWDCHITGHISVNDSRQFLTSFASSIASPSIPLTPSLAESWLANHISHLVHDAISDAKQSQEYTISDLKDHHALPTSWWKKRINAWFRDFGITVEINDVAWLSAQAEAAEIVATRKRDIARAMEARKHERDMKIREKDAIAQYEKRKSQIEANLKLSDSERSHQLQLFEEQHRKELLEVKEQVEAVRREAEKAAMEHEVYMARLRRETDTVKQIKERERLADERYEELLREYGELKAALKQIADLPGNLLAQLGSLDAQRANAAAECLSSPEHSISASKLAGLGFQVNRQSFVEDLRNRANTDPHEVTISKSELRCRDIGTAVVKGLPVNTSLQFEFSTERSGFVTLLNIGTSGSSSIHVPNPYIPAEHARALEGNTYRIPGSELLPLEQLGLDYVEEGPPGWEHIVVLVSDQPLVDSSIIARADVKSPFVKLTNREFLDFYNMLMNMPAGKWSVGILSFLVE